VPENEVRQPLAIAVAVVTETVDHTKQEQIQLQEDITEKTSNEDERKSNIAQVSPKWCK